MVRALEISEEYLKEYGSHLVLATQEQSLMRHVAILAAMSTQAGVKFNDYRDLLEQGKFYTPIVLPDTIQYGRMQECFANAVRLAMADETLTYCEGFAYGGLIPVHHAWCINEAGEVLDNTWRTRADGDGHIHRPDEMAYLGIKYKTEEVLVKIARRGYYGMFF